jgi:hypothetical protein
MHMQHQQAQQQQFEEITGDALFRWIFRDVVPHFKDSGAANKRPTGQLKHIRIFCPITSCTDGDAARNPPAALRCTTYCTCRSSEQNSTH